MASEKMSLYAESDVCSADGMKLALIPSSHKWMMPEASVCIGTVDVHYEKPIGLSTDKLREMAIKTLRDKKARILAEAELERNRLDEKINKMLMITHAP